MLQLEAGFPGSKMIPASHAIRSLLALKLFGSARHSYVVSYMLDEGRALFAGLNGSPKRAFLTEYGSRIEPRGYPKLMRLWFDAMANLGLEQGICFDLDFHTIPFHGEDSLVQRHYVSKRAYAGRPSLTTSYFKNSNRGQDQGGSRWSTTVIVGYFED